MARDEGEGGEEAVDDEEHGGERVDPNVEVGEALEELEAFGAEEGIVAGEEDLDGSRRPTEHLVEAVCEVDWSGATEGVALGDAVHGVPPTVVHAVSSHHVFRYGPIYPTHSVSPFRLVLIPVHGSYDY